MTIPAVQGQLALGFWTEPQLPIAKPQRARKAPTVAAKDVGYQEWAKARPEANVAARPKPPTGKQLVPAGHVWWVTAAWSKASGVADRVEPRPCELTIHGLQLEPANGQNRATRGAMMAYATREKKRRARVLLESRAVAYGFLGWPVRVTLTRVAPCEVDDDNLRGMMKRVRDGLCEALGFRDDRKRDGYLDWVYSQEKGGSRADNARGMPAVHHVKIRLEVLR
jgi:hypothetical protein